MPRLMSAPETVVIETRDQADTLANIIREIGLVSFDTETTSIDAFAAKPILVSQSVPKMEWDPKWGDESIFGDHFNMSLGSRFVFEVSNHEVTPILVNVMGEDGVSVIAHNFKYDAHVIYRFWGFMPGRGGTVYDSQQMDWLSDENRSGRHGLKECCEDYDLFHGLQPFGKLFKKPPKEVQESRPDLSPAEYAMETNREQFLDYASLDAYVTMLLFDYLREDLKKQLWVDPRTQEDRTLWDYYLDFEVDYEVAVWEMEKNGVVVIPEHLAEYRPKIEAKKKEIESYYAQLAGRVVNLNSTPQLQKLFYEEWGFPVVKKTKGGKSGIKKPAADKEALKRLEERGFGDVVGPLMEYRKIDKLLGTYVNGLGSHIRSNGRVHGTFNTHVVVTGRLSSSAPNLQNIENADPDDDRILEYDIRRAFVAPPGKKLIVADYSTLEVVITAHISKDEGMIKALLEGLDQHSYTAANMFGLSYEDIIAAKDAEDPTPEQKTLVKYRKAAKALTFGLLYGMGEMALAATLKISEEEAKDYIERFYRAYPGILKAKDYWTDFCKNNGCVLTLIGRRRRLPELWSSKKYIQRRAERQLFNAIIQGTGGDLMREYMPAIVKHPRLREIGALLVLQIHDEVVVEVPEEHAEEAQQIIDEILEQAMSFIPWEVPIKSDSSIADTWSEGK